MTEHVERCVTCGASSEHWQPQHRLADLEAIGAGSLLDPDCRDSKHTSCVGEPCECACHHQPAVNAAAGGIT